MIRDDDLFLFGFFVMIEYYKNLSLEPIVYFCEFDLVWKTEEWRDIKDYYRLYQVSNLCRVKSLERYIYTKNNRQLKVNAKIISQTKNKQNGYLDISIWKENKAKRLTLHRLVADAFIPNPLNLPQVNHINSNRIDNSVPNLEWCTNSWNLEHSYRFGNRISVKGEKHFKQIIIENQVLAIRRLHRMNPKFSRKAIAEKLNVNPMTISCIIYNKTWKHLL